MRKRMLKKLLLLLAVLCLTMLQPFGHIDSQMGGLIAEAAAKKPIVEKKHIIHLYKQEIRTPEGELISCNYQIAPVDDIYIKNLAANAKVTNIKSSNKDITAFKVSGLNALRVGWNYSLNGTGGSQGLKPGLSTTITFKVTQSGKTYNLKCNVVFKQQTKSPFKSLKIGSSDITSETKGYLEYRTDKINKTVKITAKPVSGIKIDKIYIYYNNFKKTKIIKNGQSVDLEGANLIHIYYVFTKKPAYYEKPTKADVSGKLPSPLHWEYLITLR